MACTCGPGQKCQPLKPGCWGYDVPRHEEALEIDERAIVADAITSELTRLRARVRELEAALRLPIAHLKYGPRTASLSLTFMGDFDRESFLAEMTRALEATDAND